MVIEANEARAKAHVEHLLQARFDETARAAMRAQGEQLTMDDACRLALA